MSVFTLPNTLRAAAVAVVLGGTAVTAMPVQAGSPSIDFSFSIGGRHHHGGRDYCMRDRQVRGLLRARGYSHIRFFDRRGRVVQVTARRHGDRWSIAFDTCRGRIIDRDRIRWH